MKIAMITGAYNKHGGVSRYVVELSERYKREHEMHVYANSWINSNNVVFHRVPQIEKPMSLKEGSFALISYLKIKKTKDEYDIIHGQNTASLYQTILTMHSCHKAWTKYYKSWGTLQNIRGSINIVDRILLPIEKKNLEKGSKKIISVSEGVKKEILENYNVPAEKITVIPNGVDLEEFKPNPEKRKEIRNKYAIEENDIVLMFSGYEFRRKGLEYIIKALPELDKNLILFAVGKSNPKSFQNLASELGVSDNIIFTGFVPEIKDYYAASDIFVFPTAYEPFGLVITEAMASGLPVITSKIAGAAELINDGYDGVQLNEPNNVNEIAEKINLLVDDESFRRQMSRNARKTAEKYSWDKVAKKTLEIYEEVTRS